ncbi:MAG: DUF305 domain-containing protein [Acidobacteriia bacterium]|nr:DUF305 domain-containing protein [Terriglobia bacterium]
MRIPAIVLMAAAAASCRTAAPGGASASPPPAQADPRPPIIQPGAPGQPSRVIATDTATDLSQVQYIAADIKFMQGMIGHHAQAIEMAALVPSRTASEGLKTLALRIDVSQKDEINMMQGWLEARGQQAPGRGGHNMNGPMLMPGMLTQEEMDRLAAATGAEFDRRFLEGMIKHHFGALTMVEQLFATPGAGQDVSIFSYASDVDADQRMEIDRMGAMLKELQK